MEKRAGRLLLPFLALSALAGCGGGVAVYDPPAEVQARAWVEPGPPTITLLTAINRRTGDGGHSALMISGAQRVMFDPAGSWTNRTVPERGDVLYGITPTILEFYTDYHARPTYDMVLQSITVSPEMAARAIAAVEANGPVGKVRCGIAVSGILNELGFAQVAPRWRPDRIMDDFATIPGATREVVRDDSWDENEVRTQRAGGGRL